MYLLAFRLSYARIRLALFQQQKYIAYDKWQYSYVLTKVDTLPRNCRSMNVARSRIILYIQLIY